MMKSALIAALFGISSAYDAPSGPDNSMCCTANVATNTAYSVCEDVMNTYRLASDQETYCLKPMTKGVNTCKYTACSSVGYCVNSADSQYYDEMLIWEQSEAASRRLLEEEEEDKVSAQYAGWGNGRPLPTPRPTNPPKTPRPTVWKAPKTPKPTNPPKTPKPTNTPRPTGPPKTPRPTPDRTPRPTRNITPRPTNTPRPTGPRPTKPVKTPKPTVTYLQPTPRPTVGGGWGAPQSTHPCPVPRCADPCTPCGANEECITEPTWFDEAKRCPACDELVECKLEDGR